MSTTDEQVQDPQHESGNNNNTATTTVPSNATSDHSPASKQLILSLATDLGITDEGLKHRASVVFKKCQARDPLIMLENTIEKNRYVGICSFFIASQFEDDMVTPTPHGAITLTEIINKTPVRLSELFGILNSCIATLQLEDSRFNAEIKESQRKLIIATSLYKKYISFFSQFLAVTPIPLEPKQDAFFQFGWHLLVAIRDVEPLFLSDFEISYQYFVSLLCFLCEVAPTNRICKQPESIKTSDDVYERMNISGQDIAERAMALPRQLFNTVMGNNQASSVFLNDETSLASSVQKLSQHHEASKPSRSTANDFDEVLMLNASDLNALEHDFTGQTNKLTSAPVYQLNPQQYRFKEEETNLLFCSPVRKTPARKTYGGSSSTDTTGNRPHSPVSATLTSISYINNRLMDELDEPDQTLSEFCAHCTDSNVRNSLIKRTNELVDLIKFADKLPEESVQARRKLIKQLYYSVLREMLKGEEQRLKHRNFTTLLTNDTFHRSLLACAADVVLFAYNSRGNSSATTDVTHLLRLFKIQPVEYWKVIESFVLHALWLSSSVKRHLRHVEEHIMEKLAWVEGSVLYDKLADYDHQTGQVQVTDIGTMTPLAKKRSYIQAFTSPMRPGGPGKTRSQFSQLFLKKVNQLTMQRIIDLCDNIQQVIIPREKINQVWSVVNYIIHFERDLMVNRHLDQFIMCAMYAICIKMSRLNIKFQDIISAYRTVCESRQISHVEISQVLWPHFGDVDNNNNQSEADTSKTGSTSRGGDIVKFYNDVFVPKLKNYILQFADSHLVPSASATATSNASPAIGVPTPVQDQLHFTCRSPVHPSAGIHSVVSASSGSSSIMMPSPQRITPNLTIYRSPAGKTPLRPGAGGVSQQVQQSPLNARLTPKTKALYTFGEHSTEKLGDLNWGIKPARQLLFSPEQQRHGPDLMQASPYSVGSAARSGENDASGAASAITDMQSRFRKTRRTLNMNTDAPTTMSAPPPRLVPAAQMQGGGTDSNNTNGHQQHDGDTVNQSPTSGTSQTLGQSLSPSSSEDDSRQQSPSQQQQQQDNQRE